MAWNGHYSWHSLFFLMKHCNWLKKKLLFQISAIWMGIGHLAQIGIWTSLHKTSVPQMVTWGLDPQLNQSPQTPSTTHAKFIAGNIHVYNLIQKNGLVSYFNHLLQLYGSQFFYSNHSSEISYVLCPFFVLARMKSGIAKMATAQGTHAELDIRNGWHHRDYICFPVNEKTRINDHVKGNKIYGSLLYGSIMKILTELTKSQQQPYCACCVTVAPNTARLHTICLNSWYGHVS